MEYSNYWLSLDDFENYVKFFNPVQTPESLAGYEYIIAPIQTSVVLYLPMLLNKLTIEAANKFESQDMNEIIANKFTEVQNIADKGF